MPAKVVLDTNAILLPFESGVRIEAELERLLGPFVALVPEPVLRELASLASEAKGRRRDAARMALALAARFRHSGGSGAADDAALSLARAEGALLFTNDRVLLRRALGAGVGVVRLKGRSHLIVETAQGERR